LSDAKWHCAAVKYKKFDRMNPKAEPSRVPAELESEPILYTGGTVLTVQ
jgi:hypothetical protein